MKLKFKKKKNMCAYPTFFFYDVVDEFRDDPNTTIGHHGPTSETPYKWRFVGVPVMAQH